MAEPRLPDELVVRQLVERALEATGSPAPAGSGSLLRGAGARLAPRMRVRSRRPSPSARTMAASPSRACSPSTSPSKGYGVTDCGTNGPDAVDYPDFAHVVARLVASGACGAGIVIDGAGIGSAMAANKVPGVRAANAHDTSMARNAREHNYANVLTLGARMIGEGLALEIADTFLATPWGAERHGRRVAKITQIEQQYRTASAEEPHR